ncbi:MAG: SMC family ATPase [Candidatus Aenigmatarchaeota archaeon]
MITRMKLKNWRSHEDTQLEFCEGTNALVGIMGSGKSSVMAALCFALFGTFPELQARKVRLEDMIMKKPKPKDEAEVSLWFTTGNDEWCVTRKISRSHATSAELRKNNVLVESPQPSKVTSEIESLLKMNYDLFSRAVYSEQNAMDMFLTIPKGQRMRKIDELLSIDRFEKARAASAALANKCSLTAEERKRSLSGLKQDELESAMFSVRSELQSIAGERKEIEARMAETRRRKEQVAKDLEEAKAKAEEAGKLEQQLATSTALLSELNRDIEQLKIESMEYAEKTEEEIADEVSRLEKERKAFELNLESERGKLDSMKEVTALKLAKAKMLEEEKIPELKKLVADRKKFEKIMAEKGVDKLKKSIAENRRLIDEEARKAVQLFAAAEEIEKSIAGLSSAGSSCPICDTRLTEAKKADILAAKKERIRKLKAEAAKLEAKVADRRKETDAMEKDLRKFDMLEQKTLELLDADKQLELAKGFLKRLEEEVGASRTEERMLAKTVSLSQKKYDELRDRAEKVRNHMFTRKQMQTKIRAAKDLEQKIAELLAMKKEMPVVSANAVSALENEMRSLIANESSFAARLDGLAAMDAEKRRRLDELESRNRLAEGYKLEIRKLEALGEQFSMLESSLIVTQEQLRRNFVSAVNQAMQIIWEKVYPYKDFYGCRLGISEGDYLLQLQDSTGWVPVDGIASGGERSIACLALRMAFSLVLAPQLSWLVLDEPTHNLDSKAVEELSNVLRENVSDLVEQVFLITHDPLMENAVSGYLYRLERDKEKDGATQIILMGGPKD